MSNALRLARQTAVVAVALTLLAAGCGSTSKKSSTGSSSTVSSSTTPSSTTPSSTASASGTSGNTASAPGITPTTIKLGFLTSLTGSASSSYSTAGVGVSAVLDAINKAGGINGRQLQLVTADDTSSSSGALTATQDLISKGVFAIVTNSSFFFGAYRAAHQAGIPVIGVGQDGPEWGQQPNTNMFSAGGGVNPNHEVIFADIPAVALFKSLGVTNVGGLAYGISPSSIASIKDMKTALDDQGLKMGYENLSVPFGTSDLSADILSLKNTGIDMAVCSCVQSTALALVTGLKQAGSNAKSLSLGGADSTLFSDPTAVQSAQGVYYSSPIPPLDTNNPASTTFEANIKAVDPSYVMGTYPTYGITSAYLAATLAVEGLRVSGQNPTRQSYIADLSNVTNYDADGLLPSPISFNHFGSSEKSYCLWYVKVVGSTFVNVPGSSSNGAFCGDVPANLQ